MELSDFFDDDDDIVATTAQLLAAMKQGLDEGQLTQEQFDELKEDLLQIDTIDELADDLERKVYVQKTYQLFEKILSNIPLI